MSNHRVYACASHTPKLVEGRDDLGNCLTGCSTSGQEISLPTGGEG